jgi:Cytochrome P460
MKRIVCLLVALLAVVGIAASGSPASGPDQGRAAPIFGIRIFPGYRDWRLISVAHEEGSLNDIRAILGNDVAIKAYREGRLPFPDGSVIARIAWKDMPSQENNKVFGRTQSFVAGPAPEWYLQFMVKDSKKFAVTGGWGFAQFDRDGKPADEAKLRTCFPCHQPNQARDFVFTRYAP